MKHKLILTASAAAAVLIGSVLCAQAGAQNMNAVTGTIQPTQLKHPISDTMYGVFFEDINFAADGGLYAELIRNRSFEFPDALHGWEPDGDFEVRKGEANDVPFPKNPHYVRLTGTRHRDQWTALDNTGFRGLAFERGKRYNASFYARTANNTARQNIVVSLVDESGTVVAKQNVNVNSPAWKEYKATLTPSASADRGKFRLLYDGHSGSVDVEQISLFPADTFNGHANGLRKDLAQTIADLKPGIFRFPGGCIVEGTTLEQRYNWKDSVGPVGNRPLNGNRWNNTFVDHLTPDYFQSYGLGFYEFFVFCEEIGAEPLPVVNVGLACQYQNDERDLSAQVALDKLEPYIQDALDLIEFANGGTDTAWGKLRAEMGHTAPFNMKYIGIGNEQWGKLYTDRLPLFLEKIRAKYPEIQVVGSSGPSPDGNHFTYLWPKMKEFKVDLVDEHYYKDPNWFLNNVNRYDNYDRSGPKVFAGEYASHDNPTNSLYAALSEAAFMTGLEKNADVVRMTSYAPLLANYRAWQWAHDLIWFNNKQVVRTPSYYVQYLYSNNKGTHTLDIASLANKPQGVYLSAVADQTDNSVIVKAINVGTMPVSVKLKIQDAPANAAVKASGISGNRRDKNTETAPDTIKLETSGLTLTDGNLDVSLKPGSFTVYRVSLK